MKLKVLPTVIALLASCVILFGGWFMYRSYAMESPLANQINKVQGVESVHSDFSSDKVTVDLALKNDASIRDIYDLIAKSKVVSGRQVELNVSSDSSPELEKWWSSALFDIAQAMETHQYSAIPTQLQEKAKSLSGLTAESEMDDQNVYIRLVDGSNSKYIILPRVPAGMGVWPNEQVH
ncbi:hypothetical protein [Gorillibacterium massiliense]|uniref:hypothetical protein n=1 Tax=Gorillibacterium massiliense TaxID=1280390 RepID=UPI0005951661|nr:hypothetical protein [Gorillibacterium massiliense]